MLHHFRVADEALAAIRAREGLHAQVDLTVAAQICLIDKTAATLGTGIWFLPSMASLVQDQDSLPDETLAALQACIWPITSVYPAMHHKVRVATEALATVQARKRLLSCVDS